MGEIDDLLMALRKVLGSSAKSTYDASTAIDNVYEGYLWSEVIRVAKAATPPWTVNFINNGAAGQDFVFRKAPGVIYSSTPFTYAELERDSTVLELHIGVRVAGDSGVSHEFDVLLLQKRAAEMARSLGRNPPSNSVVMHIEAKFYSRDLNLGIARSLVGLYADCHIKAHLASRHGGPESLRKLLKYHKCAYVHDVFPGELGPDYLKSCILSALKKA